MKKETDYCPPKTVLMLIEAHVVCQSTSETMNPSPFNPSGDGWSDWTNE